jgi:hypothetical protein
MAEYIEFTTTTGGSVVADTLADTTPEERERYLAWWAKFKLLDRINWLGLGLAMLSGFESRRHFATGWSIMVMFGVVLILATRVWLRVLICPRCGATYSGGLITVINRFSFLNKCYGCDLSLSGLRKLEKL